jgi:hypothetical protein
MNVVMPRKYDREAILAAFQTYIAETPIPIIAEFAAQQCVSRQWLNEIADFDDLRHLCATKKEGALERYCLNGLVPPAMAIFSLKQLGWTDRSEQTHKGDQSAPLVFSATDKNL